MTTAHGLPEDLDDALFEALRELLGRKLAHAATETVCEVLASRRDALEDMAKDRLPLNGLLGYDLGALRAE